MTLYLSCACLYRFLLHYLLRLLLDWFVFGNFDCSCLKCIIVSLTYCLVPRRHYVVLRRENVIEWNRGCDCISLYEFNVETKEAPIYDQYPRPADHVCKHILLMTRTVSLTSHHRRVVRERHANHFKRKSSSIPIQILKWHHLSRSSLLLFFFYLSFLSLLLLLLLLLLLSLLLFLQNHRRRYHRRPIRNFIYTLLRAHS